MVLRTRNYRSGHRNIYIDEIAETIEILEETQLSVLVEWKTSSCYPCEKKGHINKMFPQQVQVNQTVEFTTATRNHETIEREPTVQDTSPIPI